MANKPAYLLASIIRAAHKRSPSKASTVTLFWPALRAQAESQGTLLAADICGSAPVEPHLRTGITHLILGFWRANTVFLVMENTSSFVK